MRAFWFFMALIGVAFNSPALVIFCCYMNHIETKA